jgi:UDP-2-acetamido-3-amino-2,3-dideoxy-glucuronate N-acetyltransferase
MTDLNEIYQETGAKERLDLAQQAWGKYGPHAVDAMLKLVEADRSGTHTMTPGISFVDPSAKIGYGAKVWHFAVVLADVVLGEGVSIGARCEIGRGSVIGDHTRISSGTFLPPNSKVGSRVFIGPNVTFTDDRYPRVPYPGDPAYIAEPPVIEDGAVIGAGSVILPGVVIGAGCIVGAGSVVARSIDAGQHVRGEPARVKAMKGSLVA